MHNVLAEIKERFFYFITVMVEILLGAILGYAILRIADWIEVGVNSMHGVAGSPLSYGALVIEWILLITDVWVVALFALDGARRAFKVTFGRREGRVT